MTSRILQSIYKLNRNLSNLSKGGHFWAVHSTQFNVRLLNSASHEKTFEPTDQHFEQLRKEIENNGFINYKSFEQIVASTNAITNENSLLLLNSCAHFLPTIKSEEKIHLFRKAWDQLKKTTNITKDHYLSAIKVFRANKFPLNELRALLDGSKYETEWDVYEGLIGLACELGNIKEATDILAEMKDKEFPITENVFNSLILGYSRCQDLKNCETVLDTMNAANLQPSNKTYTELLKAYVENSRPEKAIQLLQERGRSLEPNQLVEIIKRAALQKNDDIIKLTVNLLPADMIHVMEVPEQIRTLCTELVYCGQLDEAFHIVSCFPTLEFNESQDIDKFGVSLINDYIRTLQPPLKTIAMCNELINLRKNTRALHIASEIALRRSPENGLEYLRALSKIESLRPHYFWPLMLHNFTKNGEIGILNTLKEMTNLKVECDFETMVTYVFPRLSLTTKDTRKAIVAFEDCGLKTSQILTPFVSNLLLQKKFDEIIWLLETYQTKIETGLLILPLAYIASSCKTSNNLERFIKVIALLQIKSQNRTCDIGGEVLLEIVGNNKEKIDPNIVKGLVQGFKTAGIQISSAAAQGLSTFFGESENGSTRSLSGMINRGLNLPQNDKMYVHPRDMSLEESECHLVELESKGLNTRGILRRILQLSIREGKLDRAMEINKKCLQLKVQRSPGMVASVFDMYVKLENIQWADETYSEIKKLFPGFILDEHKIIDYATLLVRNGRIDSAKEILQQRADSANIKGGDYLSKNVWQLLTAVAKYSATTNPTDEKNQAHEMLEYLHSLGYCSYTNTNFGTIIREYLLKNQIGQAVNEFKNITENYRKTPLQLELMSELIRLSSSDDGNQFREMLQEVVNAATKIHGASNTNINLILALAESGTANQLRKLLIDPHFKFNQDYLIRNCEHMSGSGKIVVLMKLAKASRGLGHSVKEQDLYNILLNSFIRDNNHASAIELFEKLEMDDEFKISQEFIRNLVDLLKRNNLKIPSNVALTAQMIV